MRTFTIGSGSEKKSVSIEADGPRMEVSRSRPDGTIKQDVKEFKSGAEARAACEVMARELASRGYVEQTGAVSTPSRPASKPTRATASVGGEGVSRLFEEDDSLGSPAPALPRLTTPPSASGSGSGSGDEPPKKKKKKTGGKGKKKASGGGDGLDKKVIFGVVGAGVLLAGFLLFTAYDIFLRPASIVGTWKGSRLDYEVSKFMSFNQYDLVLDAQKHAALSMAEGDISSGTYTLEGDTLRLNLKDSEGEPFEVSYKVSVGRATLDLFDPSTGKKTVQLVRQTSAKPSPAAPRPAPPSPAAGEVAKADPSADAKLVSTEFVAKDAAFKLKYPPGWESEGGGRPDNTFSWGKFTKGSAQVKVTADIAGSLLSGSDSAAPHEEGSEVAPVHKAHVLNKKAISDDYSDYNEGEPTLFKGAGLGEGRIAAFTASGGGLFGSKLRGYRITLLTGDRRVTVMCQCPDPEFEKLKPVFLALSRSVSR